MLGVAEDRCAPEDILEPRPAKHGARRATDRVTGLRRRRRARSHRLSATGN